MKTRSNDWPDPTGLPKGVLCIGGQINGSIQPLMGVTLQSGGWIEKDGTFTRGHIYKYERVSSGEFVAVASVIERPKP